ncbi:hypothetical protein PSY31_22915, partial [Shigella flexneri]|nr:hypothetical protein [Shigella flexneri]
MTHETGEILIELPHHDHHKETLTKSIYASLSNHNMDQEALISTASAILAGGSLQLSDIAHICTETPNKHQGNMP